MSMQIKSGFCKVCNDTVRVSRPGTNHILHLILTIFTGGLWILIWILCAITGDHWRCDRCGSKKIEGVR